MKEQKVNTELACKLNTSLPRREPLRRVSDEIFALRHLLSDGECRMFIKETEKIGFGSTGYARQYRGNDRLMLMDESLAVALWSRIEPLLPDIVVERGLEWHPVGLNPLWRFSKYQTGERFYKHVDHYYQSEELCMSMFTLNIYLNDDFAGGATRFFVDNPTKRNKHNVTIEPFRFPAGDALIFRQLPFSEHVHDGEKVTEGLKYLMRSDIMYRARGEVYRARVPDKKS